MIYNLEQFLFKGVGALKILTVNYAKFFLTCASLTGLGIWMWLWQLSRGNIPLAEVSASISLFIAAPLVLSFIVSVISAIVIIGIFGPVRGILMLADYLNQTYRHPPHPAIIIIAFLAFVYVQVVMQMKAVLKVLDCVDCG